MKAYVRLWLIVCLVVLTGSVLTAASNSTSGYHLIKKVTLGGEGGWDCLTVDTEGHRLFISRSSHVMVVDEDSGKVIGDIANTMGVHGIAVVSEVGRGYTSNGRDSSVTIFDLKTLKPLGQVKVGSNPDIIIYDPASKRVFTFNGGSRDATAIDTKDGKIAGTIPLDGRPEFAVADEAGHIYVNLEDKSQIVSFDSRKLSIENRWPLAPGEEPTGLAMDRQHKRLFVACGNNLMVIMNSENGKVVASVPIGSGVDGIAFDADRSLAFSSNGDGTLSVIHEDSPDKFSVVDTVTTQKGARTMALDPVTHRIFTVTAQFGDTPAPTAEHPHPRPSIVPGSFVLLEFGK
jgi:DNA-binding beta-propeller fold protein YncE